MAKHAETVRANFAPLRELADTLKGTRQFWENQEFVLSTRAASQTVNGHPAAPAKDAAAEAATRLALMTEFKQMPTDLLRLRVEFHKYSAISGEPSGSLFLGLQEYNTRKTQPGFEPVTLDGLVLPDQVEALRLLDAAKVSEMATEAVFKQSLGQAITPAERISTARAIGGA